MGLVAKGIAGTWPAVVGRIDASDGVGAGAAAVLAHRPVRRVSANEGPLPPRTSTRTVGARFESTGCSGRCGSARDANRHRRRVTRHGAADAVAEYRSDGVAWVDFAASISTLHADRPL